MPARIKASVVAAHRVEVGAIKVPVISTMGSIFKAHLNLFTWVAIWRLGSQSDETNAIRIGRSNTNFRRLFWQLRHTV